MRDPLAWSIPLGRWFGVDVRLHLLFIFFAMGLAVRAYDADMVIPALVVIALVFISVLLHEFGHCFAARQMDGDADEIMLWPLGGLASVHLPHRPQAHLVTALGGPAVNLMLCSLTGSALVLGAGYVPPLNPFWDHIYVPYLWDLTGAAEAADRMFGIWAVAAQLFYINWIQFLLNMFLAGFPLDGGRVVQCVLWPRMGYRQATMAAIFCGWICGLLLAFLAWMTLDDGGASRSFLLLLLAVFIYYSCFQQQRVLEQEELSEESAFGYDFSQGYTSLEREPTARKAQPNAWQRWRRRRAARKQQEEEARRKAEETRLDALLAKVQREGTDALTAEEQRFLNRVSAKYRDRHRS